MWPFKPKAPEPVATEAASIFTTEPMPSGMGRMAMIQTAWAKTFQKTPKDFTVVSAEGQAAMDSNDIGSSAKLAYQVQGQNIPDNQLWWYGSQGFLGYQICSMLAQNWLIAKCCVQPARDAIRTGYTIEVGGGVEAGPEVIKAIKAADKRYGLTKNLVQFVKMGRVFGIRIAMFEVQSTDPDYYTKPFNPDGVTPGSYKGINQIDPYWTAPELSAEAAANPLAIDFYEPTYWLINGLRVHRSHLIIMRGEEVPDILKPSYLYGGISVPQRIYERVYAAERTANEAPLLALSKRTRVLSTNMAKVMARPERLNQVLAERAERLNNFGTDVVDFKEDKVEHHETTLTDLDATIMTQYQLVAAAANVPATKLLATTPKGFNASGDYEENSYHEELESIQAHDLTPLIDRHHLLVLRSEIIPKFPDLKAATIEHVWNPTDTLGAKEQAEVNKLKAETGKALVESGAIDGVDERDRITTDPDSGYTGLKKLEPPPDHDGNPATRNPLDKPEPPALAAPGAKPPQLPAPAATADGVAMDMALWDAELGLLDGAELITNQQHIDPLIVGEKIVQGDYGVQVTPPFVDPANGRSYRVVVDGHHSLFAALKVGAMPVFMECNYAGSDYRNVATFVKPLVIAE